MKIPTWYHTGCFFKKVKPADAEIIKGFGDLRWDDQEAIREKISGKSSSSSSSTTSKKISDEEDKNDDQSEYSVDYAKSNRTLCVGCGLKIEKNVVRLAKKSASGGEDYALNQWFHIDCFKEQQDELQFDGNAETFVFVFFFIVVEI